MNPGELEKFGSLVELDEQPFASALAHKLWP